jgi:hypothetical protein
MSFPWGEPLPIYVSHTHPASGLTMTALTTQDCVQVFSATVLNGSLIGMSGAQGMPRSGAHAPIG